MVEKLSPEILVEIHTQRASKCNPSSLNSASSPYDLTSLDSDTDLDSTSSGSDHDDDCGTTKLVNVQRTYEKSYLPASAALEYIIIRDIGVGSTSKVQLAYHNKTGCQVALKIMKKQAETVTFLHREVSISLQMDHPNIVRLLDVIETPYHFVLVQEYLGGGDLFDIVLPNQGCSEIQALVHLSQVAKGLAYMHARGVIHRDIKPENCVYDLDGTLKLIDFGASSNAYGSTTPAGTIPYMAPEMFTESKNVDSWNRPSIDIWALGVLYFTLLTGRFPWAVANPNKSPEYARYTKNNYAHTSPWCNISSQFMFLLRKLLNPDPNKRGTAQQLVSLIDSVLQRTRQINNCKRIEKVPLSLNRPVHIRTCLNAADTFVPASDVLPTPESTELSMKKFTLPHEQQKVQLRRLCV